MPRASIQAAAKLAEAGDVIGANPTTLQLRYLQTLREIGGSQNSTVVFPMPIDLVKPVLEAVQALAACRGRFIGDPRAAGNRTRRFAAAQARRPGWRTVIRSHRG